VGEEQLSAGHVWWLVLLSYGGGAAAGEVTAWLVTNVRRHLDDPLQENVAILATPFTAFLLAETVHASGVLAVVVAGLVMSQTGPRVGHAATRQVSVGFWSLSTFVLNGALFILGLEVQSAVRDLSSAALTQALVVVAATSAVVIGVRFAWLFTTPYLVRLLDRRPEQRLRRVGARARVVSAVAGFRGAVSLAAALAVPQSVASGAPFPGRDVIVFVTAGVIVVTLAQALLLPTVVRWARLPRDTSVEQERHLAETLATENALAAIPELAADVGADPDVVERLRREYEKPFGYCAPTTRRSSTSPRCVMTSTTPRCASPSSPTSAPPCSGCATNAASMTPCCASYKPGSTSKKYACPAASSRIDAEEWLSAMFARQATTFDPSSGRRSGPGAALPRP
jgi:monovalent cation/hydrogen antiporter